MSQGKSWVYFKKKGVLWETFEDLKIILYSESCTQCPETCSILCCPFTFAPIIFLLHPSSLACITIPQGPSGSLELGPFLPAHQEKRCLQAVEAWTPPPPPQPSPPIYKTANPQIWPKDLDVALKGHGQTILIPLLKSIKTGLKSL